MCPKRWPPGASARGGHLCGDAVSSAFVVPVVRDHRVRPGAARGLVGWVRSAHRRAAVPYRSAGRCGHRWSPGRSPVAAHPHGRGSNGTRRRPSRRRPRPRRSSAAVARRGTPPGDRARLREGRGSIDLLRHQCFGSDHLGPAAVTSATGCSAQATRARRGAYGVLPVGHQGSATAERVQGGRPGSARARRRHIGQNLAVATEHSVLMGERSPTAERPHRARPAGRPDRASLLCGRSLWADTCKSAVEF